MNKHSESSSRFFRLLNFSARSAAVPALLMVPRRWDWTRMRRMHQGTIVCYLFSIAGLLTEAYKMPLLAAASCCSLPSKIGDGWSHVNSWTGGSCGSWSSADFKYYILISNIKSFIFSHHVYDKVIIDIRKKLRDRRLDLCCEALGLQHLITFFYRSQWRHRNDKN